MPNRLAIFVAASFWTKLQMLDHAGAKLKTQLLYKLAFGSMGSGTVLWRPVQMHNTRHVFIGSRVVIRAGARFDIVTERASQKFSPKVVIGDGVLIEQNFHLASAGKIIIGKRVTFSRNVAILDVWHEYDDVVTAIIDQPLGTAPVTVGDGTLVGMNCVILPGVTIGRNCMIGANSVVNRDIPDFSVAAGVPARVIKHFDFERAQWVRTGQETKQE